MNSNLEQLIIKNKNLKKLNNDYLQLIKNKEEIKNNENNMKSCDHKWVRDQGCFDDVVFYCKKCIMERQIYTSNFYKFIF